MERPTHAGLRHLALNVTHLDEMKRFYTELLGFAVEWQPDADNVYLSSGSDNLALHRSTGQTMAEASPLDHFGVIVREAEDVDRWAAFLEASGIAIDAKPRTHRDGARSCYVSDPDGNKIQIIHHPPISQKS
jgi:catechol 2,3-dioxygenase-like lactoylglutathione lyase family enzyme